MMQAGVGCSNVMAPRPQETVAPTAPSTVAVVVGGSSGGGSGGGCGGVGDGGGGRWGLDEITRRSNMSCV